MEDAFDQEREEPAIGLQNALREKTMPHSSLATLVVASHLYYRAIELESRLAFEYDHPSSMEDGEFWTEQQQIDNNLVLVLLQLPQDLRLPRNSNSQFAVFINILLRTAVMCLHKTAVRKSHSFEGPDAEFMRRQSQCRMLAAAGHVLATLRLSQDLVNATRNPIQDYAAYIAALMFMEDFAVSGNMESRTSVAFLLNMLRLSVSNPVAKMLAGQLAAKAESLGILMGPEIDQVRYSNFTS